MDNVGDFAIFRIVYSKVNYQFARMCVCMCVTVISSIPE